MIHVAPHLSHGQMIISSHSTFQSAKLLAISYIVMIHNGSGMVNCPLDFCDFVTGIKNMPGGDTRQIALTPEYLNNSHSHHTVLLTYGRF